MARTISSNATAGNCGDYDALLSTVGSFHAWVFLTTLGQTQPVITKWGSGALGYFFGVDSNNKVQITPPSNTPLAGATALSASVWTPIGARLTGSAKQVMKGGVQDGTAACSETIPNVTSNVRIGTDDFGGNFVHGVMAEACIWDVALTDVEYLALAKGANPMSIRRDHLKLYLPMYGVASPEADLSGLVKNCTITGAAAAHPPVGRLAPFAG